MNKKSISNDNPMVRAHFYTLLTGVCALYEVNSPDIQMSGLCCVLKKNYKCSEPCVSRPPGFCRHGIRHGVRCGPV